MFQFRVFVLALLASLQDPPPKKMGMVLPAPLFFLIHVYTAWILARPFPAAYVPPLMVFGVVQALIEHFADKLPMLAPLGPLLVLAGVVILGLHYRFAYAKMADKARFWCGVAGYVLILAISKTFELGFPKDIVDEQIAALEDPTYSAHHAVLHVVLMANLALTAYATPSQYSARPRP